VRDVAADEIRLYIDGVLVATDADTNTASLANNGSLYIAEGNVGDSPVFLSGFIDEVRISSGALQPSEFIPQFPLPYLSTGYR
jgi:hypothetical protein